MVNPLGAIYEGFRSLDCFLLGQADYITGAYGNFIGVDDLTEGRVVNSLRRLRGCDPANDPPVPAPPFEGGQCDCQAYEVTYTTQGFGQSGNPAIRRAWGPIGGIRWTPSGFDTSGNPNGYRLEILCKGVWQVGGNVPSCGNSVYRFLGTQTVGPTDPAPTVAINSVLPLSGTDDCGSLPPDFPPPIDIDVDVDITYNIEGGPDIDVTIPVIFKPFIVNFNGDIEFPFTFDFGGFEYSGNIGFSPEFKLEFNPSFNVPRGTDSPVDTLPPQDEPQDVTPAPPGQVVIGVAVQSVIVGEQQLTTIATQGMPSILAPRAGSIKFAYSLGISTFWSEDIDVKTANSFVPCPFSQGADAVVVSPSPGISVNWVPIFGDRLATARDLLAPGPPE